MKRASVLVLCVLAVLVGWTVSGPGASSKTAHTADPADDVYDSGADSRGPGELDVYHAMHVDDGKTITYTLHTVGGFYDDINVIHWYLSPPGVAAYGCEPIDVHVAPKSGKLAGTVERCTAPDVFKELAQAGVVHKEGSNEIVVSIPIAALRKAGMSGNTYTYRISASEAEGVADDVPNGDRSITHVLSGAGEPSAPPFAPAETQAPIPPAPTVLATSASTPSAPPVVVDVATPKPTILSVEAPVLHEMSPFLRVAAIASVLLGAGLAFVRFRPF